MWKKIACAIFLLLISAVSCATRAQKKSTENGYRSKYPYTVLGEDYELLTEEDVAISSCVAPPSPFSLHELNVHPHWQCFSLKGSAFECAPADDDESGPTAILAIVLKKDGFIHEYLSRRAIPLDSCKSHRDDWVRLTANQKYVCVSGEFINSKTREAHERAWIFESYKTKKGCDSYFQGGCSLSYQIQHGCDLATLSQPVNQERVR